MPDLSNVKGLKPTKIWGTAQRAVDHNANAGFDRAKSITQRSNSTAVADLESAMGRLFGGSSKFNEQRDLTNQMIADHLAGKVSDSTKADIGRSLLDSGVANMGGAATNDAYNAYLGLTKEGLQSQGANEYRSLYSMYRQALPLTTVTDNMRFTALDPAAMVQLTQQENLNQFNARMAKAGAQYQIGYNNQMMNMGIARDRAAADSQMAQGIASAVGSIAGAYSNSRQQGVQINQSNAGGYTSQGAPITGSYYNPQTGQSGTVARATAL